VGDVRLVQAATEGTAIQIFVKEHQAVQQGDVIAVIDLASLKTKKTQLQNNIQQTRSQLTHIDVQISALETQINAETDRIQRSISAAEAGVRGRQHELHDKQVVAVATVQEAETNLRAAEATLEAARSKRDRYHTIAETGAISADQLEEVQLVVRQQEQTVAAAQASLERAKTALTPTDAEVSIATEQVALEQASGQAHLATLTREQQSLIQQRIEMNKQLEHDIRDVQQVELDLKRTTITATADGIITKLALRNPGQVVHPGEQIAHIVPNRTPLEIKVVVSPQDIDKVAEGQSAQMRVSACPYPDYGVLQGAVQRVSKDSIKPDPALGQSGYALSKRLGETNSAFYEAIIKPNHLALGQKTNQCELQPGMEGRVDIITREETVLRFLLRKARLITDV
jgi:HlyD family type I secretion membrane fusion protein